MYLNACKHGILEQAQEIRQMFINNFENADRLDEMGFKTACYNDQLNIAKWIYSFNNIYLHNPDYVVFPKVCGFGYHNTAKWLYSLDIDIHVDNDEAFILSCQCGQLDMAKWIYSLGGVNIYDKMHCAYRMATYMKHLDVARYLHKLDPTVYANNPKFLGIYSINAMNEEN